MRIKKSHLKELIRQSIKEIDFKNQDAFDAYNKKHKMRKSTKVKVGGKDTTAGNVAKKGKKSKLDPTAGTAGHFKGSADHDMWSDDDVEKTAMSAADAANKKMDKDYPDDDTGGPSYANVPKGAKTSKDADRMKKNKGVEDVIKQKGLKDMDLPFWSVEIKGQELPYNIRAKSAKEAKHLTHQMAQNKNVELGDVKLDDDMWEKIHGKGDKKESVRESKGKRTTVKEVKQWMRKLEENRYKKTYASDARRVSWIVNNNLSEDYESMPVSMRKKWSKAQYGRERYLAKEFTKHKKAEQKLRESIRKVIKEEIQKIKRAE